MLTWLHYTTFMLGLSHSTTSWKRWITDLDPSTGGHRTHWHVYGPVSEDFSRGALLCWKKSFSNRQHSNRLWHSSVDWHHHHQSVLLTQGRFAPLVHAVGSTFLTLPSSCFTQFLWIDSILKKKINPPNWSNIILFTPLDLPQPLIKHTCNQLQVYTLIHAIDNNPHFYHISIFTF